MKMEDVPRLSTLTAEEYVALPEHYVQAYELVARATGGIRSREDLLHRIEDLIHWNCLKGRASRTQTLNRHYGPASVKVGATLTVLLFDLVAGERVHGLNETTYISGAYWRTMLEMFGEDKAELRKVRQTWINQAQ